MLYYGISFTDPKMLIPPYCITLCTQRADMIIILVQFCGPNNAAECTSVGYFHPATAHQLQRLRHLAALFGLVKCPQIQYFMILSALRLSKAMQCDGIDPLGYTTKGRDWWIPCMRINSSSGCLLSSDNAWVTRLGVVHAREGSCLRATQSSLLCTIILFSLVFSFRIA